MLRKGIPCACDPDQRPASGSFNWAILVSFEDQGESFWQAKLPHCDTSELKVIFQSPKYTIIGNAPSDTILPPSNVCSASANNEIGLPFILMSEALGQPLSKAWRPASSPQPSLETPSKAKVLSQLGRITWNLAQLRFDKIGSLFEENESFNIKECLSRGHMMHERFSLSIPRGPFTSKDEFYDSLISAFSEHAEVLPLSHHCFIAPVPSQGEYPCKLQYENAVNLWNDFVTVGGKIDSADNRLDYIITGDALREIIQKLELPASNPETFPLYHPDLSVNNIYVDDDYNITCIIDWAFASSIPESMLLTAPGLPQYRDEISLELQVSFIDGFIAAIPGPTEGEVVRRYRKSL
ncbi:hypothetical protein N7470_006801 [Penicillium chermesinum]|nr:hypothetical protein N7470_006801 [Penicillium chermesinum]